METACSKNERPRDGEKDRERETESFRERARE